MNPVTRLGNAKTSKIIIDKEWLRRRYFVDKLSLDLIAVELKISKSATQRAFTRMGFKALSLSEARKRSSEVRYKRGPAHHFFADGLRNREGYLQILCADHHAADKYGYVFIHRILAESKLGRRLNKNEHVHHIDGNPKNNFLSNLQVVSNKEHMSIHMTEANKAKRSEKHGK